MPLTNSLNKHIDISLYYSNINEDIFQDPKFTEVLDLVENNPNRYVYAIYGDNILLKNNLYVPVFHTTYLSCRKHNVVINNTDDLWLLEIFPNNKYYVVSNQSVSVPNNVKIIRSIKEII